MKKKLLSFFSIAFLVAIFISMSLTNNWWAIPLVLIFIGIILLIINWQTKNKYKLFWQQPAFQQNTNTIVKTIVVLVLLSLLNILVLRYDRRWDITENQVHTLSPFSKAVLAKLEQPLEVWIFDRNLDPNLKNLLENYRRQSKQFNFKTINPEKELGLAREYQVESLGDIYLQYGDKKQKLTTKNSSVNAIITETQLTNSIEKIQRDRSINIYLLQGHGEAKNQLIEGGIAQVVSNLEAKGYLIEELNIASRGKIPENANLIIVAGANRQFLAAEVSSLQQYLARGGNLLLLLSPYTDIGISPLLQEWGITLDNRLIVDGSGAGEILGFGPGVIIVNSYGNHPITANFAQGTSLFPESRPLKLEEKTGIDTTPLVITNQQTWAENDLKNEEITFDPNKDISGPLNIAIALWRNNPQPSRMVVFGSSTFATNGWFEQQFNGDLILNSISWLVGEEQKNLAIRPREVTNRRINLTSFQATILDWLAWRIIPLLALAAAIFVMQTKK